MVKYYPFWSYDLLKIENWLNGIAEQGYRLVYLGAFFCRFEKNCGNRIYYRARYIEANKEINGAFYVGDLYIYYSEDPLKLPPAAYIEDAKIVASKHANPYYFLFYMYYIAAIIRQAISLFSSGDSVFLIVGIASLTGSIAMLLCFLFRWIHTNIILNQQDTKKIHFLVSHSKPLFHIALIVTLFGATCGLYLKNIT